MGLFLFFVVLFHIFIVGGQTKTLSRLHQAFSSKEAELTDLNKSVAEKREECERWIQAGEDLKYLNDHYFYQGERSILLKSGQTLTDCIKRHAYRLLISGMSIMGIQKKPYRAYPYL